MELNRRLFLKGAAVVGAATIGTGVLAACSSPANGGEGGGEGADPGGAPASGARTAASLDEKWAFEIPPDPIPDSDISETITNDFVIIGSGLSGVICGASAVTHGVTDLVLFSAGTKPVARGGSFQAINSKYQRELGIVYTPETHARSFKVEQYMGAYEQDKRKWARWINNSADFMDWMIDLMATKGLKPAIEVAYEDPDDLLTQPPSAHNFWAEGVEHAAFQGAPMVAQAFADAITDAGCEIHYSTKALYLLREGTGPVTGVVAERADGSYVKYEAKKAVVLATGDFSKDPDMMAKYSPTAYRYWKDLLFAEPMDYDAEMVYSGLMDGHGQKMGLWIGAAWQKIFPCPVMCGIGVYGPMHGGYNNFWGINLNVDGQRYQSENTIFGLGARSVMNLKKHTAFSIWDVNYANTEEMWDSSTQTVNDVNGQPSLTREEVIASWDAGAEDGGFQKADTIEELLDKLVELGGINKENALKSIADYNKWVEQGLDEEFHVNPSILAPISTGPFYGVMSPGPSPLTVLGGLRTNDKNQVCDEEDEPIPGLYNVGTMTGDFYSNIYTFGVPGMNIGSTVGALSYMLGKDFAAL